MITITLKGKTQTYADFRHAHREIECEYEGVGCTCGDEYHKGNSVETCVREIVSRRDGEITYETKGN